MMRNFKKITCTALAFTVALGSLSTVAFAADATDSDISAEQVIVSTGPEITNGDVVTISLPEGGAPAVVDAADTAQTLEADFLVEKGILKGTENGLELDRAATNAEALTLLYRVAGKTAPEGVQDGHWAQGIIDDAVVNGYIVSPDAQTTTLYGTLEVGEDEILLKSQDKQTYALNTDENTMVFSGDTYAALSEKIKSLNGKEVSVAASMAMTKSIPPQTYAYYIIENTENSPVYMEISEVEEKDGIITAYSADGLYKIAMDKMANVTPMKTKNIVKAQELKKGDRIMVYSKMATLSIPALMNPEKVILVESSADEFVPDDNIETTSFLNLISGILPNFDASAFKDAEGTLTRGELAKICYAILK